MKSRRLRWLPLVLGCVAGAGQAQTGTALVRHAPAISGTIEGSVRQMRPENITLGGDATLTSRLLVPGSPVVTLSGRPHYGGTLEGSGGSAPTDYAIRLTGNATLGNVVRRTDAIDLPAVAAPSLPQGTRTVMLTASHDTPGEFASLRTLTITGSAGSVAVPPGVYGAFTANGATAFVLGVAGAAEPAHYTFERLALEGQSELRVVGPVVVTLAGSGSINGLAGSAANPGWLTLRLAEGDLTLNGSADVHGVAIAPAGTVILKGGARLIGGINADGLAVNSGAVVRLLAALDFNHPPAVAFVAPENGASFAAPAAFSLTARATDADGTISNVAFFAGTSLLGERTRPDSGGATFSLPVLLPNPGTYTLTARATDDRGSSTVTAGAVVTVTAPTNQPPTIALQAPADGDTFNVPAMVPMVVIANDADGAISRVEFLLGGNVVGEATSPDAGTTSSFTRSFSVTAPGVYTLSAKAYDNAGAAAVSPARTITVQAVLPYFTGFETADGYRIGPVSGQAGWVGAGAAISDTLSLRSTQSLLIGPAGVPGHATRAFPAYGGESVVFLEVHAKSSAGLTPGESIIIDTEIARVAITRNAAQGELHVLDGNGVGGGAWRTTGFTVPLSPSGQSAEWLRLTLREDFFTRRWDLYVDGRMIAHDVGYADSTRTLFSQISLKGAGTSTSAFDDFYAGFENPLFADADRDGLDDAWEIAHGLNPLVNDRHLSPAQNGFTAVQAFQAGADPNEFYHGIVPVLVPVGGIEGFAGSHGVASVRVIGPDGRALTNAPVTLAAIRGVALLSTIPASPNGSAMLTMRTDEQGLAVFYLNHLAESREEVLITAGSRSITMPLDPPPDRANAAEPVLTAVDPPGELGPDDTLRLRVTDRTGKPLANTPVTFKAAIGEHLFSATPEGPPAATVTVLSGPDGLATVYVFGKGYQP